MLSGIVKHNFTAKLDLVCYVIFGEGFTGSPFIKLVFNKKDNLTFDLFCVCLYGGHFECNIHEGKVTFSRSSTAKPGTQKNLELLKV